MAYGIWTRMSSQFGGEQNPTANHVMPLHGPETKAIEKELLGEWENARMDHTKKGYIANGFLLLMIVLLSGCANSPPAPYIISASSYQPVPVPAKTYVYECNDGHSFTARVEADRVRLVLTDQTISLPMVPSDSGMKFSDGTVTFQIEGDEAWLVVGDEIYRGCQSNLARAVWESAKLRGIDFRAVGNEPGWSLEINHGGSLLFITNYGEDRYVFATPIPVTNEQSGTTIYLVQDAEHKMTVILRDEQCQDDMSGEAFDTAVTLIFDGKRLKGCGKALR